MAISYTSTRFQAIDQNGRPMVGATLYTYQNKTTTLTPTWKDKAQAAFNTNPVVLDSRGEAVLWLDPAQVYTFELRDWYGALVWSQDDISGAASQFDFDVFVSNLAGPGGSAMMGVGPGPGRTQADRNAERISVNDEGADPTGVADSTSAFIDAGPGAYVPPGEYVVDTSLVDLSQYHGPGIVKAKNGNLIALVTAAEQPALVQKLVCQPFFGFDNSVVDTSIYPSAWLPPQGVAYVNHEGKEKIFVSQSVSGGSFASDERSRITEFNYVSDGSEIYHVQFTSLLNMSHACDLSALVESSDLWLYTTAVTPDGISVSTGGGKGWSKIKWMGASTSQGDITSYRVFGNAGSGHRFESYIGATPAASTDGKYVVIVARHSQAAGRTLFLYNRKEVEAAVNPLNVDPIYAPVAIRGLPDRDGSTLQGLACDGKNIYCLWGFVRPFGKRGVTVHTLQGDLLRTIYVDGPTSDYTRDELLNHPTLGFPNSFEPEGMTLRGDELLVQMIDTWRNSADIVTFEGRNWASVGADNINLPPTSSVKWVETAKAATRGAWNPATTYGIQFGTYRAKKIYSIRAPKGEAGEKPLSSAMTTLVCPAADTSPLDDTKVSVAFNRGADYAVSAWESAGVGHLYNAFRYRDNRLDVFDTREGSNNSGFSSLITSWNGTDQTLAIRSSGAATASGAGVSYYGNGDSTYPGAIREFTDGLNSRSTDLNGTTTFTAKSGYAPLQGNTIGTGNSFEALRSGALIGGIRASSVDVMFAGYNGSDVRLGVASDSGTAFGRWAVINSTGAFEPILDDLYNIGSGSVRVKQVYAAAGTINTSDENEKQKITPIDDAALRAWANVQFCQFKFNNAVAEKGSDARWHFGVIAQRVQAAFNLEGLDAFDYGLLCLDVWDEQPEIIEDGEVIQEYRAAGSRLGVRYDEALALECAYLRNRLNNGEL